FQKGLRGLEVKAAGFESKKATGDLRDSLKRPNAERVYYLKRALEEGMSTEKLFEITKIDPWFLDNLKEIVEFETDMKAVASQKKDLTRQMLKHAKQLGFSDVQLGEI